MNIMNNTEGKQTEPETIGCPHCGSIRLATNDLIPAISLCSVYMIDGKPHVDYEGTTDVFYDGVVPDESVPAFHCRDCFENFDIKGAAL